MRDGCNALLIGAAYSGHIICLTRVRGATWFCHPDFPGSTAMKRRRENRIRTVTELRAAD